ncbi:amidase signature enzyme [Ceratobasidium sp. AG-I]|nr:amidase signature enzyme [Ceratobasidium sp. AG-I]
MNTNVVKKQDQRAKRIEYAQKQFKLKQPSQELQRNIIKSSISEMVDGIRHGHWTAYDTVATYIIQAIKAHQATNCLTEILFEQALKEATNFDETFQQTGPRGPLHGVPMTFKDQYEIKDYDNTIGFTHWADKHATQDAELVAQARRMGAIIIAKTNVPQTMMSFECGNPLWGATTNPYSKDHTSGGSSGGEAAVLRFSGSALGLGSDVGGSLRIPTSYCGIYSLKPTDQRFSGHGAVGCVPGFMGVTTVYGPMARSVADVKRACEVFFGAESSTPSVNLPPVKYRTDIQFNKSLQIGYFKTDLFVRTSPACQRAVQESIDALKAEGHTCKEIDPPDVAELLRLFVQLTAADGYKTMMSKLESDKQEPALFLVTLGPRLPAFIRAITSLIVKLFVSDESFSTVFSASRPRTVSELWAASAARISANDALQRHFWAHTAGALGLDAIVCPVQALPAVPHGSTRTLTPLASATIAWNVVECPVGVVPVTRVDPAKDALPENWLEQGKKSGPGKRLLQPLDDPVPVYDVEKMKGLPIGVQIVGRPWEDEKVVHVMEILDRALGERGFGPGLEEDWRSGGRK